MTLDSSLKTRKAQSSRKSTEMRAEISYWYFLLLIEKQKLKLINLRPLNTRGKREYKQPISGVKEYN